MAIGIRNSRSGPLPRGPLRLALSGPRTADGSCQRPAIDSTLQILTVRTGNSQPDCALPVHAANAVKGDPSMLRRTTLFSDRGASIVKRTLAIAALIAVCFAAIL